MECYVSHCIIPAEPQARVGNDGAIQLAITLDFHVLHWLFERAVTLKGERAARETWTAYLKNNPKTLSRPHLCHPSNTRRPANPTTRGRDGEEPIPALWRMA
jgi:hypothetical protein